MDTLPCFYLSSSFIVFVLIFRGIGNDFCIWDNTRWALNATFEY